MLVGGFMPVCRFATMFVGECMCICVMCVGVSVCECIESVCER
jgi:hypothetical protein